MSNPTILVESFNGSLGSFSGVNPIRYDNGLWIERAGTNLIANPVGVNTTNWNPDTNLTITAVTLAVPINGITTGFRVTASADKSGGFVARSIPPAWVAAGDYVFSSSFYIPTAVGFSSAVMYGANYVGATSVVQKSINMGIRDTWQSVVDASLTIDPGDLNGGWIMIYTGTLLSGQWFEFTAAQAESGLVTSSPIAGSMGSGYAWTSGAANAERSTRAASSATKVMAAPVSAACWYSETVGGAKQFAYLPSLGALGTYGSIAHATGTLTISTTRSLSIGPFAAFDRALSASEQAKLAATTNWSLRTLGGSKILMPLSRRRPR